ncbi:MAG: lipoprotein [Myxococcales bacterium]|nr:lipoprotein [Myxococcales bacterium]MDP3500120.1 lipoprotein [Myxococcales bacterium]
MFRLLSLLLLSACGIKGPPKPPLEKDVPPPPAEVLDAGCCREAP